MYSKYEAIPEVARSVGFLVTNKVFDDECDICWSDHTRGIERLMRRAHFFQRLNHFPGMSVIYNKDTLAFYLQRLHSTNSNEYSFTPITWILPRDFIEVVRYFATHTDNVCLIVKPSVGSQGNGIYIAHNINCIDRQSNNIVQLYIKNPMLLNGYKFDLRIYVLVLSCNPLRIFVYRDGLVRLCTMLYEPPTTSNTELSFMHLTNYSLNKTNKSFVENDMVNEEGCSKRSISWFMNHLQRQGRDTVLLWRKICDIIVKTLIAAQPKVISSVKSSRGGNRNDNPLTCFEVGIY